MALTPGTDTFGTILELNAYWLDRNDPVWPIAVEPAREAAARKAYEYLVYRYDGEWAGEHPGSTSQTSPFPRNNLVDTEGRTITGTPAGVKTAQAILAKPALSADLVPIRYKDGLPRILGAGPVRIEFGQTVGIGGVYWQAEQALAGLLRNHGKKNVHFLIRR